MPVSLGSSATATALNVPGPVIVPTDGQWGLAGTANDSVTFQRALNALGAGGGTLYIPQGNWRVSGLVPPAGVSFSVVGASKGTTILRPPVAAGAATVWDLTGHAGDTIEFRNFKIEGRAFGVFDTTGMKFSGTNGVRVYDVWFNGLLIGTYWVNLNTDDALVNCNYDICGTGNLITVANPTCILIDSPVYTQCAQDLQITGADGATFAHTNSHSLQATLSILATNCTNLVLDGHQMDGANIGVKLDSSQDVELRNVRHARCTTDYVNVSTTRVFTESCNGNLAPFIGAQLFAGRRVANKKEMVSTAAPSTLAWNVGDYVKNSAPAVGQPIGWFCTVAGTPGTWVADTPGTGGAAAASGYSSRFLLMGA